ncbi:MAG TPA: hypothetical protein VNZ45_05095 [Bacteroidia bacterium]|nr:hypothetical protein [Bacteroidia bacterium]
MGHESRNAQELRDSGMISENRSAIANMPQEVMIKHWPSPSGYAIDGRLDDTIRGINEQMSDDVRKGRADMNPKKV